MPAFSLGKRISKICSCHPIENRTPEETPSAQAYMPDTGTIRGSFVL